MPCGVPAPPPLRGMRGGAPLLTPLPPLPPGAWLPPQERSTAEAPPGAWVTRCPPAGTKGPALFGSCLFCRRSTSRTTFELHCPATLASKPAPRPGVQPPPAAAPDAKEPPEA